MKQKIIFILITFFLLFSISCFGYNDIVITKVKTWNHKHFEAFEITLKNNGDSEISTNNISIKSNLNENTDHGGGPPRDKIISPGKDLTFTLQGDTGTTVKTYYFRLIINPYNFEDENAVQNNYFSNFETTCSVTGDTVILYSDVPSKCKDKSGEYIDTCASGEYSDRVLKHYLCTIDGCYATDNNACGNNAICDKGRCILRCKKDADCNDLKEATIDKCDTNSGRCGHIIECKNNEECNDNEVSTKDICGGTPKQCSNTIISECLNNDDYCPPNCVFEQDNDCDECSSDIDCQDNLACTMDICNGTPKRCSHETKPGCELNGECVPYGTLNNKKYCDADNSFKEIKQSKKECTENYECSSGICDNGKCKSKGFFASIGDWFKSLFGKA